MLAHIHTVGCAMPGTAHITRTPGGRPSVGNGFPSCMHSGDTNSPRVEIVHARTKPSSELLHKDPSPGLKRQWMRSAWAFHSKIRSKVCKQMSAFGSHNSTHSRMHPTFASYKITIPSLQPAATHCPTCANDVARCFPCMVVRR